MPAVPIMKRRKGGLAVIKQVEYQNNRYCPPDSLPIPKRGKESIPEEFDEYPKVNRRGALAQNAGSDNRLDRQP
jgi:hypothetical protein